MALSDATGNHWEPRVHSSCLQGADASYYLLGPLDPTETYRLRVKFTNRKITEPRDQWVLPPIPLPAIHTSRPLKFVTERNGIRVQALEVLGPWSRVPNRLSPEPGPHVRLSVSPKEHSASQVVLVQATDQQGRDLVTVPEVWAKGKDSSSYYQLKNLPGVKTLHLTFGIHRSYEVEFLARPEDATSLTAPASLPNPS